jgi:hypothetical protein
MNETGVESIGQIFEALGPVGSVVIGLLVIGMGFVFYATAFDREKK